MIDDESQFPTHLSPSEWLYALERCPTRSGRFSYFRMIRKKQNYAELEADRLELRLRFSRQVVRALLANGIWSERVAFGVREQFKDLGAAAEEALNVPSPLPALPAEPDLSAFEPIDSLPKPLPKTDAELEAQLTPLQKEDLSNFRARIAKYLEKGVSNIPQNLSPVQWLELFTARSTNILGKNMNFFRYVFWCQSFEKWLRLVLPLLRDGRQSLERLDLPHMFAFHQRTSDNSEYNLRLVPFVRDQSIRAFSHHRTFTAQLYGQPLVLDMEFELQMLDVNLNHLCDQVVDALALLERALPEPMHLYFTGYKSGSRTDRVFRHGFNVPLGTRTSTLLVLRRYFCVGAHIEALYLCLNL